MRVTENDLDQLASHSLRIELLSSMVLIYKISIEQKQQLIARCRDNSAGYDQEMRPFKFLWFETSLKRQVVINIIDIARIVFCYDYNNQLDDPNSYFDNFKVLERDTTIIEEATAEGNVSMHVTTEEFLPRAILYHKGISPDDAYSSNPLLYYELSIGCLGLFGLELDDEIPLRQFINFLDADGEENFIPLNQIIVLEFDDNLLYDEENEEEDEEEDEDEEAGEKGVTRKEIEYNLFDDFDFNEKDNGDDTDDAAGASDNEYDKLPF